MQTRLFGKLCVVRPLMTRWSRATLKEQKFTGFQSVRELRAHQSCCVADQPGVYAVLYEADRDPAFLDTNPAGHFKGRDPTILRGKLLSKWVRGTSIIYLGKTGTSEGRETLQKRIKTYLSFGAGRAAAHWGGRAIWQLADADELVFAWRITKATAARPLERAAQQDVRHHIFHASKARSKIQPCA